MNVSRCTPSSAAMRSCVTPASTRMERRASAEGSRRARTSSISLMTRYETPTATYIATVLVVGNDGYEASDPEPDRGDGELAISRGPHGQYTVTVLPGYQRSMKPAGPWVKVSGG